MMKAAVFKNNNNLLFKLLLRQKILHYANLIRSIWCNNEQLAIFFNNNFFLLEFELQKSNFTYNSIKYINFKEKNNFRKKKKKLRLINIWKRTNVFALKNLISSYLCLPIRRSSIGAVKTYLLDHNYTTLQYFALLWKTLFGMIASWKFLNFEFLSTKAIYINLKKDFYKKQVLNGLWCRPQIFDIWFLKLVFFKDPWGLIQKINRWITYSHLKQHKKIFRMVAKFLTGYFFYLFKLNKLRGFTLFFKGKLGRKGSVRKTKFFKKQGEVSYSTKNLRVNYRSFQIFTSTGVIGAGISLFYKNFAYILFYVYIFLHFCIIFNFNIFFCL